MMRASLPIWVAMLALNTGCRPEAPPTQPSVEVVDVGVLAAPLADGTRFLSKAEIDAVLASGPMNFDEDIQDGGGTFEPNGYYTNWGRATVHGTYTTRQGSVCLMARVPGAEIRCRSVFERQGDLYLGLREGSAEHGSRLIPAPR